MDVLVTVATSEKELNVSCSGHQWRGAHFALETQQNYNLCTPLYNKWFTDSKATLYFSQLPGSLLYMGLGSILLMAMLLMAEQELVLVSEFLLSEVDELHCNPSVE